MKAALISIWAALFFGTIVLWRVIILKTQLIQVTQYLFTIHYSQNAVSHELSSCHAITQHFHDTPFKTILHHPWRHPVYR